MIIWQCLKLCSSVYISFIESWLCRALSGFCRVSSVAFLLACSMAFSSASASRARARLYFARRVGLPSLFFPKIFSCFGFPFQVALPKRGAPARWLCLASAPAPPLETMERWGGQVPPRFRESCFPVYRSLLSLRKAKSACGRLAVRSARPLPPLPLAPCGRAGRTGQACHRCL